MHFYYLFISSHFWLYNKMFGYFDSLNTFDDDSIFSLQNSRTILLHLCVFISSGNHSDIHIYSSFCAWVFGVRPFHIILLQGFGCRKAIYKPNNQTHTMQFNVYLLLCIFPEHIFIAFPPVSVRLPVRNE